MRGCSRKSKPVIITRPTNTYGPDQYPEKLIPFFVYRALNDQPVPVYGSGQQQRDWLHVDDHCRAIETLLQKGEPLSLPHSRPMPSIGARCHELRVNDRGQTWRVVYRIDSDAVVILEVFAKKTAQTPRRVIDTCRKRLQEYDSL
jgi:dTDP-D-glucose 4,6-dehydratase